MRKLPLTSSVDEEIIRINSMISKIDKNSPNPAAVLPTRWRTCLLYSLLLSRITLHGQVLLGCEREASSPSDKAIDRGKKKPRYQSTRLTKGMKDFSKALKSFMEKK